MKLWCFFVLLTNVIAGDIYAGGLGDVKHIPYPDVQIKLPAELIGEFEFPAWNEISSGNERPLYYVIEIHALFKYKAHFIKQYTPLKRRILPRALP
jgi:hypothetical protein